MYIVRYQGLVLRYPTGAQIKNACKTYAAGWDLYDDKDKWLATIPLEAIIESPRAKPELTQQQEVFE